MKKLTIIIALFLINLVSALNCDYTLINSSVSYGATATPFTVVCGNPLNETIKLYQTGSFYTTNQEFPLYFSKDSTKTIIITFKQFNTTSSGSFYASDGTVIPITINVAEKPSEIIQSSGCIIDIFPTIMTNIKIQQGETKTRNIQLSVPSCFNTSVLVNGVALQTDEKPIQTSELNLGTIQPGHSILIPIEINAKDVSVGQYSDTLQLLLYDNMGKKINVPSITVTVLVSSGITPINNFSFSQLPTCSLDSITLNLNNTYKMTCSIPNPNIQVKPVIDTRYIRGVSVTETSTQFVYEFKAITLGQSSIGADFIYKFAPIGSPFIQDIKITPSGAYSPGSVNLNIDFYQNGVKLKKEDLKSTKTVMLVVDNSTGNMVSPFEIYINGIKSNDTTINLEAEKSYDLRVTAMGYNDLIMTSLVPKKDKLDVLITPNKDSYSQGEIINITSNEENVTVYLNDVKTNPVFSLPSGNVTIKVSKEGFTSGNKTIYVESVVSLISCSPPVNEWAKGKEVVCDLSKNVNWTIKLNNKQIANGDSSRLNFKIDDSGPISIMANGNSIYSSTIKSGGWFNWLSWSNIKKNWYYYLGVVIILVMTFYYFKNKSSNVAFS